jgi:hypothetical protein
MWYARLLFFFVVLGVVASCSHKQTATHPPTEFSETVKRIVNTYWLEQDVLIVHHPDTIDRNITNQFPAPERDDVLILADDGTYRYEEGASKFDPLHKQVFVEGKWTVDESRNTLQLTANGSTDTYSIVEATDSTLVLKLEVVQPAKTYAYTLSFNRVNKPEK